MCITTKMILLGRGHTINVLGASEHSDADHEKCLLYAIAEARSILVEVSVGAVYSPIAQYTFARYWERQ
jgi:hypothetical protein